MDLTEAILQRGTYIYRFIRIGDNLHLQPQKERLDTHLEFADGLGVLSLIATARQNNPNSVDAGEIMIVNTPEERSKPTGVRVIHREQRVVDVGNSSSSLDIPVKGYKQTTRKITFELVQSLCPGFDVRG